MTLVGASPDDGDVCFVCRNPAAQSVCGTCNLVAHTDCLAKSMLHGGMCQCCPVCGRHLAPEAVLAAINKAVREAARSHGAQHEATMRLKIRLALFLSTRRRHAEAESILAALLEDDRSAMNKITLELCLIELASVRVELGEVGLATRAMVKLVDEMESSEGPFAQPLCRPDVE